MNENEVIEAERRATANVYSKKPIVVVRGSGVKIWDINGKEYIDFMGSYGVCLVGHSHPRVLEAIREQASRIVSCHGSYYNDARSKFLEKITGITPKNLSSVFLSNSGAEAVECAIKVARKFSGKPEIIALMGAFHGKTMGALSATWDKKYREPFKPLVPSFIHVPFGKIDRLSEAVSEKTCAVLVEPIQGEGGIKVPPEGYLKELRELCDEKNLLMIADEVQSGLGRTGRMFAFEHSGITPDILCIGKAVAGGVPMGVTVAREDIMSSLKVGEHSTTFGGNPLACAAGSAVLDVIVEEKLPERAAEVGDYFKQKLEQLKTKHGIMREVRGLGLMLAAELRFDVLNIILGCLGRGVLIIDAGRNILRFLPPLIIGRDHVDKVIEVLDLVLGEEDERLRTAASNKDA